jgi:RNA polymerase sigma-70 factor (ECF subfamily)
MATLQALDTAPPHSAAPAGDDSQRRLIAALGAGDRAAAEELVERTYRRVYSLLHRLTGGDAELAADLTQETYRKAWSALGGFDGRSRLGTWLHRIAYTTFLNHRRRPQLVVAVDDPEEAALGSPAAFDPQGFGSQGPPADEAIDAARGADRLRRAVLALPESLRYTVTARFWGELPVGEIARQEGVTSVAVRKRLRKAMAILADSLQEVPT